MPHIGGSRGHTVLAGAGTGPRIGGFAIGATQEEADIFNERLRRGLPPDFPPEIQNKVVARIARTGTLAAPVTRGGVVTSSVPTVNLDPANLGGGLGDDPLLFGADDVVDLLTGTCEDLKTDTLRNLCLLARLARDRFSRGDEDGLGDASTGTVDVNERGTSVALPQRGTTVATQVTVSGGGFVAPTLTAVSKWQCPRFGNGKIGILWQSKMDGTVTCLPRGVSGAQFGLQRLHKPGTKPLFTGGDVNCLNRAAQLMKVEKRIDKLFRKLGRKSR